ncbi:LuxR C-terminal-related transcriptional regulator [Cellulomonas sp. Marseille-Q8402]
MRRTGRVERPRLLDRLARAADATLTVVSAPAGFGKTTLLTEWAATSGGRVAWLSLDARDDDPGVLWRYLLAAVARVEPAATTGAEAALAGGEPVETVLTTLLNDLDRLTHDLTLVLDDYHVLTAQPVLEGMAFLVDHLPPQVRLVVAGRTAPALPLPLLRARGQLAEVRVADLRFTAAETASYAAAAGLDLDAAELAVLAERTEGWAAALQLVTLAVRDGRGVARVLAGSAGADGHLADYLVAEVLARQPAHLRTFLLRTSVLGRLTGSLCDAVTGQDGGAATLDDLHRADLLLVPLDEERRWFRYHHLFAEVLAGRLDREEPGTAPGLHRRAGAWHEQHGDLPDAVDHALAAGDLARAAELVERAVPAMRRERQDSTLRRWFDALPPEVVGARPALALGYAGALLAEGRPAGVGELLGHVERGVAASAGTGPPAPEASAVLAQAAIFRAAAARAAGDDAAAEGHALRALDLVGPDEHLGRGAASGLLGLVAWSRGDLAAAEGWWSTSLDALDRAGHRADTYGALLALGDIRVAQGRLADAADGYAQALAAAGTARPALRGTADMHVALAAVLRERDEPATARAHLDAAAALGEQAGLPQNRHRRHVVTALLRATDGDVPGAVAELDEAERVYVPDFFPDVRPVAAVRAGLQARAGMLDPARRWVRERGLTVDDEPQHLREHEHLTLVRVLLAEHRADPAAAEPLAGADRLLARVLAAAEAGGRTGTVIEGLVLRSLVHQARGDRAAALAVLDRAVRTAGPLGHVRLVADEGPAVAALLRELAAGEDPAPWAVTLADVAGRRPARAATGTPVRPAVPEVPGAAAVPEVPEVPEVPRRGGVPVPPLSARERDVLRLLGTDLDGPEIARHLVVSVNTVRTHTKSIYAKLGVHGRRAAVRRAGELGLLRDDPRPR